MTVGRSRRVGVVGAGLVGRRAADALAAGGADVVVMSRAAGTPAGSSVFERVDIDALPAGLDAVVLATESLHQVEVAERWLRRGVAVVSTADRPDAVRALWTLRELARRHGTSLAVGVACAPGLSTLLVERLAGGFEVIDAITTARFGTGGPTCAREHHRSMAGRALEVREGAAHWVRGGSGRRLIWFPEPAGPHDCYRAGLAEPFLLHQRFPAVARIESVQAATRRDRLTAHLPMLRPPHAEGLIGAVWVEVRGRTLSGRIEHRVLAATAPQATAAAALAAAVALASPPAGDAVGSDRPASHGGRVGDPLWWCGAAEELLQTVAKSVQIWAYDGAQLERTTSDAPIQAARKRQLSRKSAENRPMEPPNGG